MSENTDKSPPHAGPFLPEGTPNPFAPFLALQEQAAEEARNCPEEAANLQWNLNKQSGSGSDSRQAPLTVELPVSGRRVRI